MKQSTSHFVYERIADDLRSRIQKNEFSNKKLPSERELTNQYKVNRITMRKSMRLLEKEKLIFRDGTRGTFIGRRRVREPRKNLIVGFVLVGRSKMDQIHSVTIMELEKQLRKTNSNMMLFSISNEDEIDDVLEPSIKNGILDAIVFTGLVSPGIATKIAELGLPSVLFGHLMYQSPVELTFDRVCPDSVEYSCEAVKYLAGKGHTRIALINGPGYQWFLNVYQGYMKAMDELDLPYEETLVEKCARDNPAEGMRAMDSLLDGEKPTAVFIANERLGIGVLECLKRRGVNHPEDIEIITVGTDNSELPGNDKIETVAISWTDMVESAVRMLFERIENSELPPRSAAVPFYIDFPRNVEK